VASAGRVVLVTGVSRDLGRRFARAAAAHPNVERVIGVDVVPPRGDIGGMSFVRADIRNPVIAKVIAKEDVDTVVHLSIISTPGSTGGRSMMKELNVIGTMQLLAACQKSATVKHLLVKSTAHVYGASSRDPAMFTETSETRRAGGGYAKDVAEIEGYVRGFARRRPDVCVTTLRCANVIGPKVDSPMTTFLRLPVIPRRIGFDPRLQFLHESDLYAALGHALRAQISGTFNVAGSGVMPLSQVVRRLQRPTVPVPSFGLGLLRPAHVAAVSPELRALLTYGRGIDTTRTRDVLGFEPAYSTAAALDDFASDLVPTGGRIDRILAAVEAQLPARRTGVPHADAGGPAHG
jgi:UDP-glucose 4-epimerase